MKTAPLSPFTCTEKELDAGNVPIDQLFKFKPYSVHSLILTRY